MQGCDGDVVVDLVADAFAADDAVFAVDGFDAVKVLDLGVPVAAGAYLVGHLPGEQVEVLVLVEEALDVASVAFAFEVVVDGGAHEGHARASGVFAMGLQAGSYLDYGRCPRCGRGSGTGGVLGLIFGKARGLPSRRNRGG